MDQSYLRIRLFRLIWMKPIIQLARYGGLLIVLAFTLSAAASPQPVTAQTGDIPLLLAWSSTDFTFATSLAWGDYDDDGDLDLAVGNGFFSYSNQLYRNDNGVLTASAVWSSYEADDTWCVAWGDVDGDLDLDLAVVNEGANRLYRNDDGMLTPSAIWSSDETEWTYGAAWGDYDGDGDLDLAVGNHYRSNRLYRNDGEMLTTSAIWSSEDSDVTNSVAWGDVDGDGDLDLVVGNWDGANRLYRNDGGTLTTSAVWSSDETDDTESVAWGDYDGDGDLDLAVGNHSAPNRLYRNDEGTLTASAVWASDEADYTCSVAWGDYDSDGDLDLVVGNMSGPNQLYQNDGSILMTSAIWASDEVDDTATVEWGDVDGDGDLDLAVGGHHDPIRVYRNEGGGLPTSPAWSSVEAERTYSLAWGDYDGDGDLDLAVGNEYESNRLYRNDDGTLATSSIWVPVNNDLTASVAWGDYDGDGDLDLMVGNAGSGKPNRLYRNDGGTLATSAVWSSVEAERTYSLAWGDYDDDGDLDLAVGNNGQPNQLYRNDSGTLTASAVWSSLETDDTESIAWGDYDGDGDLDLAVGNRDQPNRLYRNDGVLTDSAVWASVETDSTRSVAWGDYDGDGDLDLVVGSWGDANRLYRNDSGTLTASAVWLSIETDYTWSVAWGDYDGDGDLDLAVGNGYESNRLYRNDSGTLTVSAAWSSVETDCTLSVAWGDYDGDGDLDFAVGNSNDQSNRLYRNDSGELTVTAAWSSVEADGTESVAWGDYDDDGDLDLAVGNWWQPNRLYRNDGGLLRASVPWSSVETDDTESMAWGDYDGDGDLDLAAGNQGANRLYRNDDGVLTNSAVWVSAETDHTWSVAWGDYDGDGDLDLAAGNNDTPNRLYRNDDGTLTTSSVWSSTESDDTHSVAWGDYDGDGDLDLAVGNTGDPNRLYRNDGAGLATGAVWSSLETDITQSVTWGDYDGDGDLDLAVGNYYHPNRLYRTDGGTLTASAAWSSTEADVTNSVAWGDYDGDGDLDLAVGNGYSSGQPNRLYRNDGGELTTSSVWSSLETDITQSVAWGDYDGDGDLDLAVGNDGGVNQVYQNLRRHDAPQSNHPSYVTIPRPGPTDDADFFSTPHVIQEANVPITYTLFDPEGDVVAKIFPEFSPNGGGQWFPATPGSGGDGVTNLDTSPEGRFHTFVWNAEADLIKSDNVVFRIRAQSSYTHGPILWPAVDGKSPSFRVAALWYIKVVDDSGSPIAGATVYANGQPITQTVTGLAVTDQAGLLNPGPLEVGTALAALSPRAEQPTVRDYHDSWAYRTHLTTQPFTVIQSGEQRLAAQRDNPLVLFNLVVSIEWDADEGYTQQISRAVRYASDYLYDLSDGQMAFGQVDIYDDGEHWADADLQISTKNIVRPHAYIGGIISDDKSHVIRVGRFWNGNSGNWGPWDQLAGFRTLAHEFGHYAFHLYDEYFAYVFDQDGNLIGEVPAYCTGPENRNPDTDATNASVMDYQYTTSELSASDVPGLWSPLCEQTAQWQLNGESAWETLARTYADFLSPPRWQFTTPMDRGGVFAGPDSLRSDLLDWPQVEIHQEGPSAPLRHLTVHGPEGPYWGALVALYTNQGGHPVAIDQGFTNQLGQIYVYGAQPGDTLRAASFDGALSGSVSVTDATEYAITMSAPATLRALAVPGLNPHLTLRPGSDGDTLHLRLSGLGPGGTLAAIVTQSGGSASQSTALAYSSSEEAYVGSVTFSAPHTRRGTGTVQVIGAGVGSQGISLNSTYALQAVPRERVNELYSADGNLHVHLITETLPVDAYAVLSPVNAAPTAPPEDWQIVGNVYDVKLSGALGALEKPGILTLHYDGALVNQSSAPEGLHIYHWDRNSGTWRAVPGSLDEEQRAMVAPVTVSGIYALMAPPGEWSEPLRVFLTIILKGTP